MTLYVATNEDKIMVCSTRKKAKTIVVAKENTGQTGRRVIEVTE